MSSSVTAWMRAQGLDVKSEFVTPWGICDLAGLAFRQANVRHRLRLGQRQAIGSILRASLLVKIPDVETGRSTTLSRIKKEWLGVIHGDAIELEVAWLVSGGFVVAGTRGRLQKLNGWAPLHRRLVAIELKLARVEEVLRQASHNLRFADESYIALPAAIALRVYQQDSRWRAYVKEGIGLLSVDGNGCRMLVKSRPVKASADPAVQLYCVEKFWRTRATGNSSLAAPQPPLVGDLCPLA